MANKNIVLCSDGTGNRDIKARGTNVFKLYEAVDIQGHKTNPSFKQQVAFYDDGVGTSSLLPLKIIGGALGIGFKKNVRDLYTALVHVYQSGDSLYLFGFSRGAYTIRALAGMIQYCGILDVARVQTDQLKSRVRECWDRFAEVAFKPFQRDVTRCRNKPAAEDAASAESRRRKLGAVIDRDHAPHGEVPIEFVGVWDTVGAIGVPFDELRDILNVIRPMRFYELAPGRHIKRACHALSIDDERRTFHPELWNEQGVRPGQIEQVWFAGVHSNVGGGYPKQGMSLVALDWMMAEAERCGLRFIPSDRESIRAHQDVHGKLYDSRAGLAVYYRWAPRDIAKLCKSHNVDTPKVHVSAFERIANGTDGYAPGNIPFTCEVVTTNSATPAPWPDQAALQAVKQVIAQHKPAMGHSLLDTVQLTIVSGKLAYYSFLGSTVLALWWLYDPPGLLERVAGTNDPRWLIVAAFAIAGLIILLWSWTVDGKLTTKYASFWSLCRSQLRQRL